MFVHRLGFFRGPWEVHRLPGGDSYRITLAPTGGTSQGERYPFDGTNAMRSITWWALKDRVFHLQARVVEGILEIHRAVYPRAREVRVEALLREYGHTDYLARVADELADAVRWGQLRVELLPPVRLAMQREQAPEKPRAPQKLLWFVAFKLVDQEKNPVPRRRFRLTTPDKDERDGRVLVQGRERFDQVPDGS